MHLRLRHGCRRRLRETRCNKAGCGNHQNKAKTEEGCRRLAHGRCCRQCSTHARVYSCSYSHRWTRNASQCMARNKVGFGASSATTPGGGYYCPGGLLGWALTWGASARLKSAVLPENTTAVLHTTRHTPHSAHRFWHERHDTLPRTRAQLSQVGSYFEAGCLRTSWLSTSCDVAAGDIVQL